MPKRSMMKDHIASLEKISEIISAMKNLSLMETSRATKYLNTQTKFLETIQNAAVDFLQFHSSIRTQLTSKEPQLYILLGSERGFCGNFNELIVQYWNNNLQNPENAKTKIIIVGNKLASKISPLPFLAKIDGANVAEEIDAIVLKLMIELEKINTDYNQNINPENWVIIWNEETDTGIHTSIIKPLENFGKKPTKNFSTPPLLYLKLEVFLIELLNQYLFAVFHQIFYQSFVAENRQRLKHMDVALDWIEKKNTRLKLQLNQLRQEEITEEIEVVMLNNPT